MVRVAERIAKKKARHKCHRHAALILKSGNIIATGWNHENIHAEHDAIVNAQMRNYDLNGCEIVCIRVMRSNKLGMAKPCAHCAFLLKVNKFKRVHYTDSNGNIITERI